MTLIKKTIARIAKIAGIPPHQVKTGLAGNPGIPPHQAKTGLAGGPGIAKI